MSNLDYFYFFLRYKIDAGIKQIDLAHSEHVSVSRSYLSRLYKGPDKNCSLKIQEGIAKYFGLSYEEMIEEAKKLFDQQRDRSFINHDSLPSYSAGSRDKRPDTRSRNPLKLIDQMNSITFEVRESYNLMAELERERDDLLMLLNDLRTGICVVDADLTVQYQNPSHRRQLGNLTGHKYSFFWDNSLSTQDIISKLSEGADEPLEVKHEGKLFNVQFSVTYKGNRIQRIVEHVIEPPSDGRRADFEQMEIYREVFKHFDHGFGFFNNQRELVIASNKFGLLDDYDFPNTRLTVDQLLLDIGEKTGDSLEKLTELKKAYENKKEIDFNIRIKGNQYNFQTKNIFKNNEHLGILLIVRKLQEKQK